MYLLIPGRHQALTWYQYQYLYRFTYSGLKGSVDLDGKPLPEGPVEGAVFAVTSANHGGTKRNPLPFVLRAMAIQDFAGELELPIWVVGIPDVGLRPDFASFVLKTIHHEFGLSLAPDNTVVVGSTPVIRQYQSLGFCVWGAEAATWADVESGTYREVLPWSLIEKAAQPGWERDADLLMKLHPACYKLWKQYKVGDRIRLLFSDPIVGSDGDLTESRDYGAYVRQMDQIASLKWQETGPHVSAGLIGDIGCAVGSWIKLAAEDPRFQESDFYGIEIARPLYELCQQRKANGEFANPNVWFAQRNAVSGLVFHEGRMNTIHTGSLTHEIESYGGRADLIQFIENRRRELAPEGIWINRDVIGPNQGEESIVIEFLSSQGRDDPYDELPQDNSRADAQLQKLSTLGLWRQFIQDWRPGEPREEYKIVQQTPRILVMARRRVVAEFLLHKDYTDNWRSEMHETFCFWSFTQWHEQLDRAGFKVLAESRAWTNPWILENRWMNKVCLWKSEDALVSEPWPPTTMLLVAGVR